MLIPVFLVLQSDYLYSIETVTQLNQICASYEKCYLFSPFDFDVWASPPFLICNCIYNMLLSAGYKVNILFAPLMDCSVLFFLV